MGDLNLIYKNQLTNEKWNYICEHDKLRNIKSYSEAIYVILKIIFLILLIF